MKKNKCKSILIILILFGSILVACSSSSIETEFPISSDVLKEDNESIGDLPNKEKKVYFTCQNIDSDVYLYNTNASYMKFAIFSNYNISSDDIKIEIPIETNYTIAVIDGGDVCKTAYMESLEYPEGTVLMGSGALSYEMYMCYRKIDWEEMKILYKDAKEAEVIKTNLIMAGKKNDSPELIQQQEIIDKFIVSWSRYQDDYQSLNKEDLPLLYSKYIYVYFGDINGENNASIQKTESFNEINISIGDKVYTQEIGQIRLHAERIPEEQWIITENDVIEQLNGTALGSDSYPWGNGIEIEEVWSIKAKENITITDMYLYNYISDMKLLGAHVVKSSEKNNSNIDFYWDLKTPFDIEKGECVTINLIFEDASLCQLEYGARVYLALEYKKSNETYTKVREYILDRPIGIHSWLRYGVIFDELSEEIESYVDNFYRPVYETWREELPW